MTARHRGTWVRAAVACVGALLAVGSPRAESVTFRAEARSFEADVLRPAAAPRGTVVLVHGFMGDRRSLITLARELADRGALVIVPDLPFLVDAASNAGAIASVLIDTRAGRLGAVPARTVLVGYSSGGLASLLAAAHVPGITGWIGLDPVDRDGEGLHSAARVSPTAIMLRAAPDRCNAYSNSHSWGSFLPRLQQDTLIQGATHCDFQDAGDPVCAAACGLPDAQRQAAIRAEVVTAVDQWLQ